GGSCRAGLLIHQRFCACGGLAHLGETLLVFERAGGFLETQVELFLLQGEHQVFELFFALGAEFSDFHDLAPSPRRGTNLVLIGSLAEARSNASRAVFSSTPSISNRMRPGSTRATQNSTEPLPEPMRTSAGLRVTGTSGNTRIHNRPTRFT